jgi:hypothetical protein
MVPQIQVDHGVSISMTNVEQLEQAGLIQTHNPLTPDEVETVNNLSSAEVSALISVKAKLGDSFFQRKVQDGDGHRLGTLII